MGRRWDPGHFSNKLGTAQEPLREPARVIADIGFSADLGSLSQLRLLTILYIVTILDGPCHRYHPNTSRHIPYTFQTPSIHPLTITRHIIVISDHSLAYLLTVVP